MSYLIAEGNIARQPRTGQSKTDGRPWARVTVIVNDSERDPQTGQWTPTGKTAYELVVFGQKAETLGRLWAMYGTKLLLLFAGELKVKTRKSDEGEWTSRDVLVDELGLSVRNLPFELAEAGDQTEAAA